MFWFFLLSPQQLRQKLLASTPQIPSRPSFPLPVPSPSHPKGRQN